jgi:hypothetical protein
MTSNILSPRTTYRAARGTIENNGGNPKICVRFEQKQFSQINDYARSVNSSFAEAIRCLIDYAFDKLEEENKDTSTRRAEGEAG